MWLSHDMTKRNGSLTRIIALGATAARALVETMFHNARESLRQSQLQNALREIGPPAFQPVAQALISTGVAVLCLAVIWLYWRGGPGRRLDAVAGDSGLAASLAIDPVRTRLQAFGLAGAMAGLGGGLFAHHAAYIEASNFSLMMGVHAVAYTLMGGLANVLGPVLGTAVDIVFLEGLRVVGAYRMVAFGSLIVVLLIVRPQGLLGTRSGGGSR